MWLGSVLLMLVTVVPAGWIGLPSGCGPTTAATDGTRGGGGTKPPGAKVDAGSAMVCAAETTATVCVVPLWTAVVVNSLQTGPLVGVSGTENLIVAALLPTLAATLVCVVRTTPPTVVFMSDDTSTDTVYTVLFIRQGLPILAVVIGRELTVDDPCDCHS